MRERDGCPAKEKVVIGITITNNNIIYNITFTKVWPNRNPVPT
jgi:hypothetical protein